MRAVKAFQPRSSLRSRVDVHRLLRQVTDEEWQTLCRSCDTAELVTPLYWIYGGEPTRAMEDLKYYLDFRRRQAKDPDISRTFSCIPWDGFPNGEELLLEVSSTRFGYCPRAIRSPDRSVYLLLLSVYTGFGHISPYEWALHQLDSEDRPSYPTL